MANPGMLFVTMQPQPGLPLAQFHEWYNNEHGPTRLRLPFFQNGLRYRAADGKKPEYLAVYNVTSMPLLETSMYKELRENRSAHEAATIAKVDVERHFWDLVSTKQSQQFIPSAHLTDIEAERIVLFTVELKLKKVANAEAKTMKWYDDHVDMLSRVTGWLRSRILRTSSLEIGAPTSFIVLHEFANENRLGDVASNISESTPGWVEVQKSAELRTQRVYSLFYIFGPAPRDLENLAKLGGDASSFGPGDPTNLSVTSNAVISCTLTLSDRLAVPYRLEGNPDSKAPTIAFVNSLLTSYHMWDPFIKILKKQRPKYRILRYDFRGRGAIPYPRAATLDMLSDDLSYVMGTLRIPKLDTLIGVSMGGATTLKFALDHPDRLNKFIACDFNVASSPSNTQAWKDRIAVAENPSEGMKKLAGQTVERWFHPSTMEKKPDTVRWITDMVAENNVDGFKHGCQALWNYDMNPELKDSRLPGLLVVGEADGKGALVKAMDGFKDQLGKNGARLAVVPEAGHLPMCENPEGFWKAVEGFI
ncbi:alpha/beta-hydrolase [Annulohypoxylon bovei var. microspora]|nr:alpha/beta-hydrolase [Annulohypoxylon bovei var. microspora]